MTARDVQRGRVYAWEDAIMAELAPGTLRFEAAQPMVDALWAEQGLRHPPRVERLPVQARRRQADADRLRIRLPPEFPAWLLLHELAHALSTTFDGRSDGHGPRFMGLYLGLLIRYLRLPEDWLLASLSARGIRVARDARPAFLDP
ncbi:hypothetical protein [Roseomonas sp. KE0001]|uniref:hypothetical protein n=1 Tax=Roseomonas sp. KE0001 TaxID=2479201 RepID=UPI0018DFBCAC|nr:hypothetical protein [Roseomonas sp. KE0001]